MSELLPAQPAKVSSCFLGCVMVLEKNEKGPSAGMRARASAHTNPLCRSTSGPLGAGRYGLRAERQSQKQSAERIARLIPKVPHVRLVAVDHFDCLMLSTDVPTPLPESCDSLRLRCTLCDELDAFVAAYPGIARLAIGGGGNAPMPPPARLGRFRRLELYNPLHINAIPDEPSSLVSLGVTVVQYDADAVDDLATLVGRQTQLRDFTVRLLHMGTVLSVDEVRQTIQVLTASTAPRVRLAYVRPWDPLSAETEHVPLAKLVSWITAALPTSVPFRELIIESHADALDRYAHAALTKLRTACEAIGVRLGVEHAPS